MRCRGVRRALGAVVTVAVAGAAPPAGVTAESPQPAPVYAVTVADATTDGGGVPPAVLSGAETTIDSFTADVYERPFRVGAGGRAAEALPAIDIVSARAGAGDGHLHYRIDLAAVDPHAERLSGSYTFEVDYDDDPAGDLLVRVDDPGSALGTSFGTGGVSAFWNQNSNVTGPNPGVPDGPDASPDGYEEVVFEQGRNRHAVAEGGDRVVLARVAPDRAASVELAMDAHFLQSLNADLPVTKVSFRPGASVTAVDHRGYYLHDRLGRAGAGSPYPYLQLPGAPSACPASDADLTAEQRAALDSGTGAASGLSNPCYPAADLSAYDNAVFVTVALGAQAVPGQSGPDLSLSAAHVGRLAPGSRLRLFIGVRNSGNGRTTGPVTLSVPLPAGVRLASATGRGWRCRTAGQEVRCQRPAALGRGEEAGPVEVAVVPGSATPAKITLAAHIGGAGDTNSANNSVSHEVDLEPAGRRGRSTLVLVLLGTTFVGSLLLSLRLGRVRARGTPSSSPFGRAGRHRHPPRNR